MIARLEAWFPDPLSAPHRTASVRTCTRLPVEHRNDLRSENCRKAAVDCVRWAARQCVCFILAMMFAILPGVMSAAVADEQPEREQTAVAARFLQVLIRNPRYGTAFDRVYAFHSDRGSISAFAEKLERAAKLPPARTQQPGSATSDDLALPLPENLDLGEASLILGMIELKHSEVAAAVRALQQSAEQRPEDPVALWYLARAQILAGRHEDATRSFEAALSMGATRSDRVEIFRELARHYQKTQQADAALATWQRLEQEFPGDLRVRTQIATTLAEDGRWEEALSRFLVLAKNAETTDQSVQANLSASDAMLQLGRTQEAVTLLESQLSRLDPDSWLFREIRRRTEDVFRSRSDLRGLVSYYEEWLRSHPEDIGAVLRLARTLSLLNRTVEAGEWYRRGIERAPTNVPLRESLIDLLVREQKFHEAITQYEQLAKFDVGNPDHLEAWGQLYLSVSDLSAAQRQAEAANVWERLLTDRPDDPVVLARVAQLMRRAELPAKAVELYRAAIQKAPGDAQYREYLGEYLQQLQRTDEAISVWSQMAEGGQRTKGNLIRLAEVLNRFGHTDRALKSMRDACLLNPGLADRLQFAELLRNATERIPLDRPAMEPQSAETHAAAADGGENSDAARRTALLNEALEQLQLAERSADNAAERQQILRERVKTLTMAAQLEQQTDLLAKELQSTQSAVADRWYTLAVYQEAAEKFSAATASALRVVELEPESIAGWTLLAALYERAGRLGDAAEAVRQLASLDRRGFAEYQRKIARLEVRLGNFDAALQAGRELMQAAPGNPEAFQMFADLAFEVGQPEAAVDALRQAVRINPGDAASLIALAKTLADEFQTAEAIELYWRAFEKASDLETQTNITVALSNLYLRSSQFERLIERLELRSRELNLPTEMTRCMGTAYREAGEFRKARMKLESLLTHDEQHVGLLKELIALAMQEHNTEAETEYQRQIVTLTPSDGEKLALAELLERSGDAGSALRLRVEVADAQTDPVAILKAVDSFAEGHHEEIAVRLCQRRLRESPDDWETMFRLAGILGREHVSQEQAEECRDLCRRILRLQLDWQTPMKVPPGGAPAVAMQQPWEDSPSQFMQWLETVDRQPATFGDVFCLTAERLLLADVPLLNAGDLDLIVGHEAQRKYRFHPIAFLVGRSSIPFSLKNIQALRRIAASESTVSALLLRILLIELYAPEFPDEFPDASSEVLSLLQALIQRAPDWISSSETGLEYAIGDRFADDKENLRRLIDASTEAAEVTIQSLAADLCLAVAIDDCELSGGILQRTSAMDPVSLSAFVKAFGNADLLSERVTRLFQENGDAAGVISVMSLAWQLRAAAADADAVSIDYDTFTESDVLTQMLGREAFELLQACLKAVVALGAFDQFEAWAEQHSGDATPHDLAAISLMQAMLASAEEDPTTVVMQEIKALQQAPDTQSLRLLIARNASRIGVVDESLLLLQSIRTTQPGLMIAKERLALNIAMKNSRLDEARRAAERLFGMPLNSQEQSELLARLKRLGMDSPAAAIEARLGRGGETRQSVLGRKLQAYIAQGDAQLAGEVAWELLRLASGGSLFSGHRPNDDRDDGGERLQAIQALGKLQRLQPLIDRCQEMLKASPDSVELLEILAEFHEAAEQWSELSVVRDRIALLSKRVPPGLKAKAVALENSGEVSAACDVYLLILKQDPAAFEDEMETFVQAFERAKRHADFLSSVLGQESVHWESHGQLLVNVVASLQALGTAPNVVQTSVQKLLGNAETRLSAVAAFLSRPDICPEKQLLPGLLAELSRDLYQHDAAPMAGRLMMLEHLKTESSLRAVKELIAHDRPGAAPVPAAPFLRIFLDAKAGDHEAARIEATSLIQAGSEWLRHPSAVSALNDALGRLADDWTDVRLSLLETVEKMEFEDPTERDEIVDDLIALYESTGRLQDVRRLLNIRVRQMMNESQGVFAFSPESIRRLLQTAERIQHSGFPIEASRLLLEATPSDIESFTREMEDDKAIAFRSRFNASLRWARQQISAAKIVSWFEMTVQPTTTLTDAPDEHEDFPDLLLTLTGVTDLRTRDGEKLWQLRVESVLLDAVRRESFEDDSLRQKIEATVSTLLATKNPDIRLLGAALALSKKYGHVQQTSVIEAALLAATAQTIAGLSDADHAPVVGRRRAASLRIPQVLRGNGDLACAAIARLVASEKVQPELTTRLLERAARAASGCEHRLVRIGVLAECAAVARLAELTELAERLESEASAAVAEQIAARSFGGQGTIDLAHEIRTRLLTDETSK